jgi:hypothetical protein
MPQVTDSTITMLGSPAQSFFSPFLNSFALLAAQNN